jgi:hypothetical protein
METDIREDLDEEEALSRYVGATEDTNSGG